MRKILIPILITILMMIGNDSFAQTFGGGDGSVGNPYLISSKAHLDSLAIYVNRTNSPLNFSGKYFRVTTDINMTGGAFTPIGNATRTFQGNFNGDGHIISNLTLSATNYVGLFGNTLNATIQNLGIDTTCSFTCLNHGGSLLSYGGTLVAYSTNSNYSSCYSLATITGAEDWWAIGGLIGGSDKDTINNCYARAKILHTGGAFESSSYGGLIGQVKTTNPFYLSNSYSAPDTIPSGSWARPSGLPGGKVGALIGNQFTPNVNQLNNTFYLKKEYFHSNGSMQDHMTTINIGIPKYLGEMRTEQFAVDLNACQTNTWRWANRDNTLNNGLPMLYWQGIGDTIGCTVSGGTPTAPYRIRYAKDLIRLSNDVADGVTYSNSYFIVENDISFKIGLDDSSSFFKPIGNVEINTSNGNIVNNYSFQGHFNGNGHVISNLTLSTANNNNSNYVGLFGNILNAIIDSIGIDSTCSFSCPSHSSGIYYGGGLVAYSTNSNFNSCYSKILLTENGDRWRVGGLIGGSDMDTINNCYARANLLRTGGGTFWSSYYGGLIGQIVNTGTYYLSNSYSSPVALPVGNTNNSGSLIGNVNGTNSHIVKSYYLAVTGTNNVAGVVKTIAEMRLPAFVDSLNASQSPLPWKLDVSYINNGLAILGWQGSIFPWDGDGTQGNPFQIKNVKDLIKLSDLVAGGNPYANTFFALQNDITFNRCVTDSSSLFSPIGLSAAKPFSGNFNGRRDATNRFAIANYKFSNTNSDNIGLFGYIKGATIKNLGISNFNITARDNVGGLVGASEGTNTIDSCFVYGHIKGRTSVGGLIGNEVTTGTTINRSFTNVTIDALTNVGGIVGQHRGSINNAYSNSEIYSSVSGNDYVGGLVGLANAGSSLNRVYSAVKIIRNGTNTSFGKIRGSNLTTDTTKCYSRDSTFVNYTNISPTGYSGTTKTNLDLRSTGFVTSLNNAIWKADYTTDNINDGYPIFTYQVAGIKPTVNGAWQNPTTASQVVIIPSGVQVKTSTANCPKAAYVKIENGGELNNQTNLSLFGEYNRELSVGKWNLIGLTTNNKSLASLINYTAKPLTNYNDAPYKTIVKRFDPATNNWATVTTQDINTQFNYGEGILVMPNYSLDANYQQRKSRIVSKGILFNESPFSRAFTNTATLKFVSLANNYPASITVSASSTNPPIAGNTGLIQGNLVYVYDTDNAKWINNLNTNVQVTSIKPSEGFFVVSSSISGSFTFNKSQIKNSSGAKNSYVSDIMYVKAVANGEEREAFLQMNEDADNGFDFNDGLMLFGSNMNAVEPFFRINAGKEAFDSEIGELKILKDAFSTLPYMTELDLRSEKVNDVSLNFSNIPSDINVYLLDSVLNTAQYLNENPDYSLKVSAGDNKNRLFVLFSYNKEDVNQFFKPEMAEEIRIWNYNNTLHIEGKNLIRYEIYDILGNRLLEEETFEDNYQKSLSLKNGIYIVRTYSKTSTKTEKISIYN